MPPLSAIATYILEISILYASLFFVRMQPNAENAAGALTVALIPILAFYAHRLEKKFRVPFFVWAIGLGYLFQDALKPLTSSVNLMAFLVTTFGVLIIFGGGLELKFKQFRKLLPPILSLAIIGAVITAFLFSLGLAHVVSWLSISMTVGTVGLLGVILCSTDPAAIIPTLRRLHLTNRNDTTVAISESAVNDVVGTILTMVFAGLVLNGDKIISLKELYVHLVSLDVLINFLKEIAVGVIIGSVSYQLLRLWKISQSNMLASLPFFIGTSLISYVLAAVWGGSGFLAAFITGLLFDLQPEHKQVEHFFTGLIDGFVKPSVFIMLGSLITPNFFKYAPLGIAASLLFILIVRPVAVTLSLALFTGKDKPFSFRDLLFFDAVRETGVIPAVLLVALAPRLPDGQIAFAIGSWVILTTLIVLPLVTEVWSKRIRVAI